MPTFEELCANAEAVAAEIENVARELQRSAHAMRKASLDGSPAKIRKAADQIDEAASKAHRIEHTTKRVWPLSDEGLTELLSGPYVDQLIETAEAAGVSLARLDGCLAAFPVIVQVLPGKRLVRVDNKPSSALRPSAVIERIRARMAKSHSRPEKFIEVLFNAYCLVAGDNVDRATTLLDVYDALTLLPDTRSAYGKAEFTRDVYELDASGVRSTKAGATLSFPASTGTKNNPKMLSIVSPDGMPKYYFGIRFERHGA